MDEPLRCEEVLAFISDSANSNLRTLGDEPRQFRVRPSNAGGLRIDRPAGGYETVKPKDLAECVTVFNHLTPEERQHPNNYPRALFTTSYIASVLLSAYEHRPHPDIVALRPQRKALIRDLVKEAGLPVDDWSNFRGEHPTVNPKYCYAWAFGDANSQIVLCLWYGNMRVENGRTVQYLNYRKVAAQANGSRKRRAIDCDQLLNSASRNGSQIRVIVVDGIRAEDLGASTSRVLRRSLDPKSWYVAQYDVSTGECRIERGQGRGKFADQFSETNGSLPGKRPTSGEAFVRNRLIRDNVLLRANGACESCGRSGFVMSDGRLYLETHHIVPLCENGQDREDNMIALCPNEHREAHSGMNREHLRRRFEEIVRRKIPSAQARLSLGSP